VKTARQGVHRQVFDSSNGLGIPDLLPDMLWTPCDRWQLVVCGYTPLTADRAGGHVYGYWTDDFRFKSTWSKPREACEVLQPQCVLLYGATAEMAATIPAPVICWTAANPRGRVPVRVADRIQSARQA
jgi:hypothetical protein